MSQSVLKLIKENLKDHSVFPSIERAVVKQARIMAIVLASFLMVALIAVVYAFVQQEKVQQAMQQVDLIRKEVEKQRGLALEAQMISEEVNKMAAEQLKACEERTRK